MAMVKVLLKDIVIPAGTVFTMAPVKTERLGFDHFETTIGLTKDSCGSVNYCIDDPELNSWFADWES